MAFCAKCGAQLKDGSAFCAACGAPAGQSTSPSSGAAAAPAPAASAGMSSNAAACLAYLFGWITGLIFLLIEPYKRDRFVRFNAFQAIFMDVAVIAISFGLGILSMVLGIISHGFAGLVMLPLWPLMWLAFLATKIFLMVKAYGNQEVKLPFIGDFAAKQASSM